MTPRSSSMNCIKLMPCGLAASDHCSCSMTASASAQSRTVMASERIRRMRRDLLEDAEKKLTLISFVAVPDVYIAVNMTIPEVSKRSTIGHGL